MRQKPRLNNLVEALGLVGKGIGDLLPAYPGQDTAYVGQLLDDCALALSRPVMPYGLLGIHPCRSRYFNVHEAGFRLAGDDQSWPPGPRVRTVFTFGGSTMVGFNVEDSHAIPAALRRRLKVLRPDCEVYNFASGSYTSRNEMVRFLDLIDRGIRPDVAVFLDGYNDSFYAYGNDRLRQLLDELYQAERRRRQMGWLGSIVDFVRDSHAARSKVPPSGDNYRPGGIDVFNRLTSLDAIGRALALSDAAPSPQAFGADGEVVARLVWGRYLESAVAIDALARHGGTRAVFCWQPQPYFATRAAQRIIEPMYELYPAGTLAAPVYHWLRAHDFPGRPAGMAFHDLSDAADGLDAIGYVDVCHYTAALSDRIAELMVGPVLAALADTPNEAPS